jgi:hypothetical protein
MSDLLYSFYPLWFIMLAILGMSHSESYFKCCFQYFMCVFNTLLRLKSFVIYRPNRMFKVPEKNFITLIQATCLSVYSTITERNIN